VCVCVCLSVSVCRYIHVCVCVCVCVCACACVCVQCSASEVRVCLAKHVSLAVLYFFPFLQPWQESKNSLCKASYDLSRAHPPPERDTPSPALRAPCCSALALQAPLLSYLPPPTQPESPCQQQIPSKASSVRIPMMQSPMGLEGDPIPNRLSSR
jgi:hypothetical protein